MTTTPLFYRMCFRNRMLCESGRTLFIPALFRCSSLDCRNIEEHIRPRRAILYVPGHDRRKIEKVKSVPVDSAVLDCEDGVALNKKDEARQMICDIAKNFDFGRTEFAVRINSVDSGLADMDLNTILKTTNLPNTLMVPKVESNEDVLWLFDKFKSIQELKKANKLLSLLFFIESAKSLLDMRDICAKALSLGRDTPFRLEGLVFGSDDFCADIGATRSESASELLTARQLFVMTAKSFKLQAIDMVHINYKDQSGLLKSCEEGARMGFTGKQVIHPDQVAVVQKSFSPSPEKVAWARELVRLFRHHQSEGRGAFTFQGAMIDRPLLLQAEHIIKMAESSDIE